MSSARCQHCGSTDIDKDPSRGDAVCTNCGSVLEESVIVTEVQFAQDSHGNSRAIGKLVSSEDGVSAGLSLGHRYGFGRESRATTLLKARKNIQLLASRLHLNSRCADTAFNFYKIALSKKLTKGRKNTHVVAACVYMVCRKEETAHMLLDLSDVLQVSVYELGKTYLKLSSALCINSPAIDPSLYILRFAHQLQFGDKTHEVSMTAARLVQRMKKDWMHTGRRPSGLCGAALLVAARLHNFNRTVDDVIKVVKVCQATVRKRLAEFGDTPSSRLTLDEFMTIDLEEEQDPPAFKNARKKLYELDDKKKMKEIAKQVTALQKLIEKALEGTRRKSKYEKVSSLISPDESSNDSITETSKSVKEFIAEDAIESIKEVISTDIGSDEAAGALAPVFLEETQSIKDGALTTQINEPNYDSNKLEINKANDSTNNETECVIIEDANTSKLILDGIDDDELDTYIMDNCEFKQKDQMWHKVNAEYLKEQKEKEERRAKEEEENADKPDQKKRRRRQKRVPIQASTAGEAIEKMLQQRKISFKLNYDVLKNLNPDNCTETAEQVNPPEQAIEDKSPIKRNIRSRPKQIKITKTPIPSNIKKGMSDIIGSTRKKMLENISDEEDILEEPPSKKLKINEADGRVIEPEPTQSANDAMPFNNEATDEADDYYDDDDDDDETQATNNLLRYPNEMPDYYEYDFEEEYEDELQC